MCGTDGWKNTYRRLDQERNGTSMTAICRLEMLLLLLIPVQWADSGMLGASEIYLPQSPSHLFTNFNLMLFICLLCLYFYLL